MAAEARFDIFRGRYSDALSRVQDALAIATETEHASRWGSANE